MLIYQHKTIPLAFEIEGHPQYGFGKDKKLYNLKTGKMLPKKLKGYTLGYNLAGRFHSLQQIRPLLKRPEKINVPF